MTIAQRRMRGILSGRLKPTLQDQYAILALIHQKYRKRMDFGVDMSGCFAIFDRCLKRNEAKCREVCEAAHRAVHMDLERHSQSEKIMEPV